VILVKELEVRIIKINPEDIRAKLTELDAKNVKEEDQINRIYDYDDGRLLNNKGYARIRTVHDNLNDKTIHYMTVKKLLSQEKYKIMEENETEIHNCDEGIAIFKALGLNLVQEIKKSRESYQYKNTLVEIDINDKSFCPFPYIEIETEDEKELEEVVSLLGYTLEDTTSATIYEILQKEGAVKGL